MLGGGRRAAAAGACPAPTRRMLPAGASGAASPFGVLLHGLPQCSAAGAGAGVQGRRERVMGGDTPERGSECS